MKYGHAEVGCFMTEDTLYVQHEIEFLPMPVEDAVDQLVIAKWMVRMLGYRYGVDISFAPKSLWGRLGAATTFTDGRNGWEKSGV